MVKHFDWNKEKNEKLKVQRDISFEEIYTAIKENYVLDITNHPNKKQYPGQRIFIVVLKQYVYLVPFVEDEEKVFLKTIIPSRKATSKYLGKKRRK